MKITDLFNLENSSHKELFSGIEYPWEIIAKLEVYIKNTLKKENKAKVFPTAFVGEEVELGEGTVVESGAVIFGPAIIGKNCTIKSGAYIRQNVILEDNVVVGHATELKNSFLMNGTAAAHFNYVGDSILGNNSHLAAGSILANVKLPKKEIIVKSENETIPTGLQKFGAALGDNAEVGCNAVLNPGSIVGKNSIIYPL
ncbi:MAG TPA: DapH/DapD/GlmU-related protein, partial [Candidatus Paceibacterota bacterium]|nr:DapH/DapD/GlmU-related protein [Candidatus Paceibacterota bacterium]